LNDDGIMGEYGNFPFYRVPSNPRNSPNVPNLLALIEN